MSQQIKTLNNINRCPHCSISQPLLIQVWQDVTTPQNGEIGRGWGAFVCNSYGSLVTAAGLPGQNLDLSRPFDVFPKPKSAHEDLPDIARVFLQQAYDSLHAPDAAAVMAGSAVDAILKAKGLTDGSLYSRIDKALESHILTQGMADWAHSVRLGSNRPRHADTEKPHVTTEEAVQSVDFAEALGNFLFVLTAKIERGLSAASGLDQN